MRCDLHVHSRFSGPATVPLLRHLCNESDSEPEAVYAQARRRGMDLVTITDHDTIEGALAIDGRSDTFVSEEVTCLLPGRRELHIGVYDLAPAQHEAIAARRRDPESLLAYLAEQRLPATLNHPFSALTGPRETADLDLAFSGLSLVETVNGMLPDVTNRAAHRVATSRRFGRVGGSDAHTLAHIGCAYTKVPGARTKREFLAGLRRGHTVPMGRSGTYARFVSDLARVTAANYSDSLRHAGEGLRPALRYAALLALSPLLPLLPLAAAIVVLDERRFAGRQFAAYMRDRPLVRTARPPLALRDAVPALARMK